MPKLHPDGPPPFTALDTETTGLDLHHGARPYFAALAGSDGSLRWWEWDVDPLTRRPRIPKGDLAALAGAIADADELVLHNAKFDFSALQTISKACAAAWDWSRVRCTLKAAHLLRSNARKDLTTLSEVWLGWDLQPFEERLEAAVRECRRLAKKFLPDWRIADEGLAEMPSYAANKRKKKGEKDDDAAKDRWKADGWLPRALAAELDYPQPDPVCEGGLMEGHDWEEEDGRREKCRNCGGHFWWVALREYALADPTATAALWPLMRAEIVKQGLWEIYLASCEVLPVACVMERRGVTTLAANHASLRTELTTRRAEAEAVCVSIAADAGYALTLPKSGVNKSLRRLLFGTPEAGGRDAAMPLPVFDDKISIKTGDPALDDDVLERYETTLRAGSPALSFVRNFRTTRKAGTYLSYLENYERFWVPLDVENARGERLWKLLHPQLNPCGTVTLRWSSSNPNEQNIGKKELFGAQLRSVFGPAPGREWWSLDYQNIELRIPAYEAGEEKLTYVYENPKEPPYYGSYHLVTFDLLWPELFAKHGKKVKEPEFFAATNYQWVKNGNFARQYGAQRDKVNRTYRHPEAWDRLAAGFPKIDALSSRYLDMANRLGYVETIPDKDVCPHRGYPLACKISEWGKVVPTTPFCYHVSGSACWVMGKAMVACQRKLDEWADDGFDAWMPLQVHDELVFDLPRRGCPKADPKGSNLGRMVEIAEIMSAAGNGIGIPCPVAIEYHAEDWSKSIVL